MAEYKVKGEEEEFVVELPELVDERTKEVIDKTLKKCVEPEKQEKVMNAFNRVISQTNSIVDNLKEDERYDEKLEEDIRRFVGIEIKKGFDIGKLTIQPEEVETVHEAIGEKMEYEGKVIEDLPEELQEFSRYIFGCLELGRISFESGLTLGILISMEKADEFYREESDGVSYIQ